MQLSRIVSPSRLATCLSAWLALTGAALALDDLNYNVTNDDEDLRKALRNASVLRAAQVAGDTDPRDLLAAASADYGRLLDALYAEGFYGGSIRILIDGREAAQIPPLAAPAAISVIDVNIDTGPAYRFGQARVSPLPAQAQLPEGFAPGKRARAALIREAATGALTSWRDAGHALAEIEDQEIIARHAANELDARVAIAPGPRLRFGRLTLRGDSAVRSARIRRIAGLPRGEVFSPEELRKAAARLRRTGTFRSVTLSEGEVANSDGTLDVTATIVDAKPRRFGAGAEISSFEGLTLSGFWLHRNLTGAADRFRIEGEARGISGDTGGVDYLLGARYEWPAVYGADTTGFLFATAELLDEPDFTSDQIELGLGATRVFSDTLTGSFGLSYRFSDVKDDFGDRRFELFSAPLTLTWDRRDDALNPTTGSYLNADVSPFYENVNGNGGARVALDARAYRAFGAEDGVVLAGRFQLGSLTGPAIDEVPPDLLFYSGGGGTVRGQPYQSLGVDLGDGRRSGGRAFMGLSLETRVAVRDNIQVVGFADAGFVSADGFGSDQGDWHSGAGLGLRYDTPVGPIRLDVAGPVGGDTGEGVQIYIGIGQAF